MTGNKAGVIGRPIGHSLSPRIHNYWIDKLGIDGSYEAIDIEEKELGSFIGTMAGEGYAGVNVTIPYKQTVMDFLDDIHMEAVAIGAVNTVVVEDGKTFGYNTDSQGFISNIQESFPELDLFEEKVVILGSGGASRAVSVALLEEGAKLFITNRTREKAEELKIHLVRELGDTFPEVNESSAITLVGWEEKDEVLRGASLLVNTTSLGMRGKDELEINLDKLPKSAVVTDIVYNPLKTRLLKSAEARGNPTADGLGMLLYQAEPGFYAWFGQRPEVTDELRQHVLEGLGG